MTIVVDSSALLALLFDEPGGEVVLPLIRGATLSAVNLDEVLHKCARRGIAPAIVLKSVQRLDVIVAPFDAEQALASAALHPRAQALRLSFAERACLALGQIRTASVVTADRVWQAFAGDFDIRLIR
ncbi:PIN domain nuclease of toxin-antitoxin system [Sphingomonas endophytica]|uniref:PIN domain nuclease of toxin-antitoxin system n=1 Tax=Sphingomonas endophytica TaxID=869719 RepID=A0A7X0MN37_9SPHN|nr:type II toxin-antitoxin system VapC family toxin [Sphingomonas endophytica]MBB6504706.1 PIN domain nuclease of toxin-antitoxin system [Sphingomonas endophytica]